MGRRATICDFESIVKRLRHINPKIALTTDLMVGFPGESADEFQASLEFVRSIDFAGGHVFRYSSRPGTAAEKMSGHVPSNIKKSRSEEMRNVFIQSATTYRQQQIGCELNVLWEKSVEENGSWKVSGLSDNYLRVEASSNRNLYNQITKANIIEQNNLVLRAEDIS
jgi:threonylcarbamoyladenosine tRNA methylthiotransferase MtaB